MDLSSAVPEGVCHIKLSSTVMNFMIDCAALGMIYGHLLLY